MKLRKSLLKKSQLYLILDRPEFNGFSWKKISGLVLTKKVGLIQLRDKISSKADLLKIARKYAQYLASTQTLFIVNDYVDLAVACGADGVHLGQEDLSLKQARMILGQAKIIGVSCHSLAQALKAQKAGADYIGIGPVYTTPTKPEYKPIGLKILRQLKNRIKIPYYAIGDIHAGNIKEVLAAGARRVAVCRAILRASDYKRAAGQLNKELKKI